MNDVKLIEQVKLYEELYNSADKNYNNHPHKEKIWFKIGKVMNTPGKCTEGLREISMVTMALT